MMKTLQLAISVIALSVTAARSAPEQTMRDAATHDQLATVLRHAQANDPAGKFTPSEGKDPSKENLPTSLRDRADMLSFNGISTMIPKGAILVTPPALAERIGVKDGAKIVNWSEFFARNRGWITTYEISLAQAEGNEPLSEAAVEMLQKSTTVVVATFQGGAISKLATKQPATEAKQP